MTVREFAVGWATVAVLVGIGAAAAPSLAADPPATLSVVNGGSPGALSAVPQPPVAAARTGACATSLTVEEANGGPSPCPPGTWPALGVGVPGPPWGTAWGVQWESTLQIAGGDVLELRFDRPMDSVQASILSNHQIGMTDPSGSPLANVAFLGPDVAQPTADPAVWRLSMPHPLDARARSNSAFSVAAAAGGEEHAFALAAESPRRVDFASECGPVYYNDSLSSGSAWRCLTGLKGIPPHLGAPPQSAAPQKSTSVAALRIRSRRVAVRCGRAKVGIKVPARGLLRYRAVVAGARTRLVRRRIARAGWATLAVTVPRAKRRRLEAGGALRARLTVSVLPAVGGERKTRRWRLRLVGRGPTCAQMPRG